VTEYVRYLIPAALLFAGAIHLPPLIGVLGPARPAKLYGVAVAEPNLEILLRHRAVLFGLLGAFVVYAAFRPELWDLGLIAGIVSIVAFIVLVRRIGGATPQLVRVVRVDVLGLVLLMVAAALRLMSPGER
jgi:hypothetical protein